MELLLVLVVLLLLLSSAVVNLDAMRHGAELREGVVRLEGLLRFARAEAALRGKRVRVEFRAQPASGPMGSEEAPLEPVSLSIESDPLQNPGEFANLPSASWGNRRLGELIQLELILGAEPVAGAQPGFPKTLARADSFDSGEAVRRTVTFDPEGGARDARLVARSADVGDARKVLVELDGLNGRVMHRDLTAEAFEELQSEADEEGITDPAGDGPAETVIGSYSR